MSYVAAPIPDLLIRIKNAAMARKRTVQGVTYSTFKEQVIKLLINYGFVESYTIIDGGNNKKYLSLQIKPVKDPINDIPHITIRSTPSRPWYVAAKQIKPVAGGRGIGILSTNKGLLAAHVAKKEGIGGLLLAEIY